MKFLSDVEIAERLKGHKIALQFSGGRDSMAVLYLLKGFLDQLTVYWTNPGDQYPETLEVVNRVREMVPNFVEIRTDVEAWRFVNGMPTDLTPTSSTPMGISAGESDLLLTDRMYCCFSNIMQPMHVRMRQDEITLIIRGVKDCDELVSPTADRDTADGFTFFYPIHDWTKDDVMTYLYEQGAPVSMVYEMLDGAPDCMGCTAWWSEGRGEYLKFYHPAQYQRYRENLKTIGSHVNRHIEFLLKEID